jgi:hypothetical protein
MAKHEAPQGGKHAAGGGGKHTGGGTAKDHGYVGTHRRIDGHETETK